MNVLLRLRSKRVYYEKKIAFRGRFFLCRVEQQSCGLVDAPMALLFRV